MKQMRFTTAALASLLLSASISNAATTLLDFSSSTIGSNFGVLNGANYQPIPGITITYANAGVYNGGPDHTPGDAAGANFNLFQNDGSAYSEPSTVVLSLSFSAPVSINSLWTSTFLGGSGTINISAFSDEAGSTQLGITHQVTPLGGSSPIRWQEFTGFSTPTYQDQIRRISFVSSVTGGQAGSSFTSNIQVDDILVSVVPEPSAAMLAAIGLVGYSRRRRSN